MGLSDPSVFRPYGESDLRGVRRNSPLRLTNGGRTRCAGLHL